MVCDRGEFCCDREGAITLGCQLYGQVMGLQSAPFQPDLFVLLEVDGNEAFF